jgi:shikimate kinase
MGTGKTEVGKELAERLGYGFIDTDELIEKKEGISISEIFDRYGEPYFRDIESEVIKDVSRKDKVVISTGGGAVIKSENRENLKRKGILVCLTASPEVIYSRTGNSEKRPLLNVADPYKRIKELLKERAPYYSQADITIDTSGIETSNIVDMILKNKLIANSFQLY